MPITDDCSWAEKLWDCIEDEGELPRHPFKFKEPGEVDTVRSYAYAIKHKKIHPNRFSSAYILYLMRRRYSSRKEMNKDWRFHRIDKSYLKKIGMVHKTSIFATVTFEKTAYNNPCWIDFNTETMEKLGLIDRLSGYELAMLCMFEHLDSCIGNIYLTWIIEACKKGQSVYETLKFNKEFAYKKDKNFEERYITEVIDLARRIYYRKNDTSSRIYQIVKNVHAVIREIEEDTDSGVLTDLENALEEYPQEYYECIYDVKECVICLLPCTEYLHKLRYCKHVFHYNCIKKWITRKSHCPHCRTRIWCKDIKFLEDDDYDNDDIEFLDDD